MRRPSTLLAGSAECSDLLRFIPIDYRCMVNSGILADTAEACKAFAQGYWASDARLTERERTHPPPRRD